MTVLSSEKVDEFVCRGYESSELDYKLMFDKEDIGAWMEIVKDACGLANFGGGTIVFGVQDGSFKPIGMDENFHVDAQLWADKFTKWVSGKIDFIYHEPIKEVNGRKMKFPILQIRGTISAPAIPKIDGVYTSQKGEKTFAFKQGVLYTRRDTSTVGAISGDDFWKLFWGLQQRTAEATGSRGTSMELISLLNKKTQPHDFEETLWSNLFPVLELPDQIFVATTSHRLGKEVHDLLNKARSEGSLLQSTPPFLLKDKRLYAFSSFEQENPLNMCVSQVEKSIATKDWLSDKAQRVSLIMLLNYMLKDLCWRKGFTYDQRRDRYYAKYAGGPPPEVTWKPYKKTATRQLVSIKTTKTGQLLHYEHFGARMRFISLGDGIYLLIEPIRVLTKDGTTPLDQATNVRVSTKKNSHYHNNNYLYDLKLILHVLQGNKEEVHLGQGKEKVTVSILPISSKVRFGITDDQHTGQDFLDEIKTVELDFTLKSDDGDQDNPLTETSLED